MSKITKFDKPIVRNVRSRLDEALKNLEAELGVSIKVGNATFSASTVTFKVEISTVNSDGVAKTEERTALETHYPDYVDLEIRLSNRKTGKVIGLNQRAHSYPFIVEASDGKTYKLSKSQLELMSKPPMVGRR